MKLTLKALATPLTLAACVAVAGPITGPATAAPIHAPGATVTADTTLATPVGGRSYSGDCKPYNGPYGYYGNPYCERGFTRDGEAGGYEIDLTRYFDERYYSGRYDRDRRYRRSR